MDTYTEFICTYTSYACAMQCSVLARTVTNLWWPLLLCVCDCRPLRAYWPNHFTEDDIWDMCAHDCRGQLHSGSRLLLTCRGWVLAGRGLLPLRRGFLPTCRGLLLTCRGLLHTRRGLLHTCRGFLLFGYGLLRSCKGQLLAGRGLLHTCRGLCRVNGGLLPTCRGVLLGAHEALLSQAWNGAWGE